MVVAKYLRFSKDDGKADDSESVKNQRDLLDNFISGHEDFNDCEITEFVDDGYTGRNFQRPGLVSMMDAVKLNKVSCIVVKDFSRFGRNFIEVSDYIDQIFPFLGVRFIAVTEQYDSKTATAALGIDMAMKNLVHDYYSKDLSQKIRSARQAQMKKGEYIAAFALFGYTNKAERKRLVIDPPSAAVVKRIFGLAVKGENTRQIAMQLNNEGVLTPNHYKRSKPGEEKFCRKLKTVPTWDISMVRGILQDERYTGKMVNGKKTTVNGKQVRVPKEEWIIVPGTHEAIVSHEEFIKAQAVIVSKKRTVVPGNPKSVFVGMVKCHYCNRRLAFKSYCGRQFHCINFNREHGCDNSTIAESVLIDTVFAAVKAKLELVKPLGIAAKPGGRSRVGGRDEEKRECETRLKKLKLAQSSLLEQYLEGNLSKSGYQTQKAQTALAIQEATDSLANIEARYIDSSEIIEKHKPYFGQESLTRETLKGLVVEVRVASANAIEITWTFQGCYDVLLQV